MPEWVRAALKGWLALVLTLLTQPGVWARAPLYEGDTFWHLAPLARIGLASLSLLMIGAVHFGLSRITPLPRSAPLLRFAALSGISAMLFAGLLFLAPQIYYTYYLTLIPDLPVQWVVGWPPLADSLTLITFPPDAPASAHLTGGALWSLVLVAAWRIWGIKPIPTAAILIAQALLRLAAS